MPDELRINQSRYLASLQLLRLGHIALSIIRSFNSPHCAPLMSLRQHGAIAARLKRGSATRTPHGTSYRGHARGLSAPRSDCGEEPAIAGHSRCSPYCQGSSRLMLLSLLQFLHCVGKSCFDTVWSPELPEERISDVSYSTVHSSCGSRGLADTVWVH